MNLDLQKVGFAVAFAFAALVSNAPAAHFQIATVRPADVHSTADVALVSIVVVNTSGYTLYLEIPPAGSERIRFAAGAGWRSRWQTERTDAATAGRDITVVTTVGSGLVLVVEPRGEKSVQLDLRDYFKRIDFNEPSVQVSLKLVGVFRDRPLGDAGGTKFEEEASWSGEVIFPANPKGTEILL